MNISSNISSIQSHQTLLNNSAHNIANVNTDGFVPNSTNITNSGKSVIANTRQSDDNGSLRSQTDLAKEIPNQIIAQDVTAFNVTAIKAQDEVLGSLLDIKA
jgi:flagellar hook protein FlgE